MFCLYFQIVLDQTGQHEASLQHCHALVAVVQQPGRGQHEVTFGPTGVESLLEEVGCDYGAEALRIVQFIFLRLFGLVGREKQL